jgi:FlaA1/EpsC-like NDP-sugar epimerase/lipopolysaccharide/colanic/teichoic acid biosynthesis glycosyltransferase
VTPTARSGFGAQRVFDVVIAMMGIVLALPVVALAALLLKLTSTGPLLVKEERMGGGRSFQVLRLRTTAANGSNVLVDSGRSQLAARVAERVERFGIAAVPELINVLKGEMSIVGPRPTRPDDLAGYTPTEGRLLDVRPGLISPVGRFVRPASARGGAFRRAGETEVASARLAEIRYFKHRSLAADTWVVLRAVGGVATSLALALARFVRRVAGWLVIDSLIAAVGFYLAYFLRFLDATHPYGAANPANLIRTVATIAIGFGLVNVCFRLHRHAWRYASGIEILPIAAAASISTLFAMAVDLLQPRGIPRPLPLSVVLFGGILSGIGFALFRFRYRILAAFAVLANPVSKAGPRQVRAVVYGAGEVGQLLARRLKTHADGRGYKLVAFLDDDRRKQGLTVHGIKVVGGRDVLRAFVAEERIDVVVLAMGRTSSGDVHDILALAQGTAAQIKVAQDMVHWMGDRYSAALLRDIRAEDLIGRQAATLDKERCRELVTQRSVLVTGASGSIGAELIRQILELRPARIVAVDMNESGLYDLGVEIKALSHETELRLVVGDVTHRRRMLDLVSSERPDVIFHVAAYKHVPLMELHPQEAAWTNVWGTWVMFDAAQSAGVRRFVLVSTDKAVNPSSIMGATKRMAELLMPLSGREGASSETVSPLQTTIVRFGNVLGSRGSVIPTFERQIELGGAVTVTDPNMTRFFMHPGEAAALIIEAASLSDAGDVFMLDMGDRVRIDDLARKMIRMRGLRPDIDVPIEYTGLRPGEKLHEELIYAHEQRLETRHPRVFEIRSDDTVSSLQTHLIQLMREFKSDGVTRPAFTAALVKIAVQLVASASPAPAPEQPLDRVLVGRRGVRLAEVHGTD